MSLSEAGLRAILEERVDHERRPPPGGFTLDAVRAVSERLGRPGHAYPVVHVAGTCGKGTTSALVAAAVHRSGQRAGLTTSPHLIDLWERIRIGPSPAPSEAWTQAFSEVLAAEAPQRLTYFELVILTALVAFRRAEVDLAVVEVGLGGRLDATQVVGPCVSVITRIARDHTRLLGVDEAQIAREKAGILRPGVPLVAGPGHPAAREAIAQQARAVGSPVWWLGEELRARVGPRGVSVAWPGGEAMCPLRPQLAEGAGMPDTVHPAWPEQLALAAGALARAGEPGAKALTALPTAARSLRWHGRFEVVAGSPPLILDGAHDPAACSALESAFAARFPTQRAVVLLALARDKDLEGVVGALASVTRRAVVCDVHGPRTAPPQALIAAFEGRGLPAEIEPAPLVALERAQALARAEGLPLLVTGSLHLVGTIASALALDVRDAWGGDSVLLGGTW
jgi:dihydrofolate synthase/folylpolyglutamate synthase